MIPSPSLLRVIRSSSDPNNPAPEEIVDAVRRLGRVAVVGISRDPMKPARRVPSYLATKGVEIIPVNPYATRILGKPVRRSLAEVTEPVDLVLLFRPSAQVGPFVKLAAGRAERPVIWMQEGIRSDEEAGQARAAGLTVVQDLCIYKVHRAMGLEDTPRGRSSQSGSDFGG